jgi:hypothetical protein
MADMTSPETGGMKKSCSSVTSRAKERLSGGNIFGSPVKVPSSHLGTQLFVFRNTSTDLAGRYGGMRVGRHTLFFGGLFGHVRRGRRQVFCENCRCTPVRLDFIFQGWPLWRSVRQFRRRGGNRRNPGYTVSRGVQMISRVTKMAVPTISELKATYTR